mmetsp:Transcript_26715/g.63345  ORF Transcript_26715/g.63345 Transcript_26715/m.63345 type:complete len:292 (-) Transcript_26715:1171-2046(-)
MSDFSFMFSSIFSLNSWAAFLFAAFCSSLASTPSSASPALPCLLCTDSLPSVLGALNAADSTPCSGGRLEPASLLLSSAAAPLLLCGPWAAGWSMIVLWRYASEGPRAVGATSSIPWAVCMLCCFFIAFICLLRSARRFCPCSMRPRRAKIASSACDTRSMNFSTFSRSTSPPNVRYPPRSGSISLYFCMSSSMAPSRISSEGLCGRKSFPTKKHMNTKSSNSRSGSLSNGRLSTLNSSWRYSRSTATRSSWNGFCTTSGFSSSTASPLAFILKAGVSLGCCCGSTTSRRM